MIDSGLGGSSYGCSFGCLLLAMVPFLEHVAAVMAAGVKYSS
jgi:hypothetical protein